MNILNFFSRVRVLTAIIFIAITFTACIVGEWFWSLFIIILMYVGVNELIKLLNTKDIYPNKWLIYLFDLTLIILASFKMSEYFIHVIVFAFMTVFISFLFTKRKPTVSDISSTLFAILYTGLLPVYFILTRNLSFEDSQLLEHFVDPGAKYLILILITIWASDIGAYYVGTKLGKTKLCPEISPKKTVEGAVGGTLLGIIMALIVSLVSDLNLLHSFILSIIVVIAAQLGDLCESLIKRDVGVKDSGDIVPGHGGILDRADSYIFTAAASYYYIKWVVLTGIF